MHFDSKWSKSFENSRWLTFSISSPPNKVAGKFSQKTSYFCPGVGHFKEQNSLSATFDIIQWNWNIMQVLLTDENVQNGYICVRITWI